LCGLNIIHVKLSPHFGHCQNFIIYNIQDQTIVNEDILSSPPHQPGILPNWLVDYNITDLIGSGIGHKAIEILNQNKINVFVGVPIKKPKLLIQEYLDGVLETNGNLCNH